MKKFYFTFGQAHSNSDRYQVIFAANVTDAHEKMFAIHGRRWADSYTQEYWLKSKAKGFFKNLTALGNEYSFAS